jgi:hypothetical protein
MSAPSASSPSSPLRGKFARLIAALLLLAATWHALTPGWSPVEPAHGSAFNAATAEMAVAPARPAESARAAPLPIPALPVPAAPRPLARAAVLAPAPVLHPDSTGPPAGPPRALLPEPRAPPFA